MEEIELISPDEVADLKREKLLPILTQTRDIYVQLYRAKKDLQSVNSKIQEQEAECDKIRNQVSEQTRKRWFRFGVIAALLSVSMVLVPLVIWYFMRKNAYKKDLEQNQALNEQAAQNYYAQNVTPLLEERETIQEYLRDLETPVAWAKDIVTPEIFDMGAMEELKSLVENRRADTLKEALNLFDSHRYQARMESMQKGILANSDTAAAESTKQTEFLRQTEKNTRNTATAAKRTAANTYKSYKIQKKQARENR